MKGSRETERLLYAVMQRYGFSNIKLLEQFHKDSSRLICKVSADDKIFMIRGLPEITAKDTIEGNVSAHAYLGNCKQLSPRIICMPDGANYTKEAGYWFYVLEYIAGEHLKENETDEKELGRVLRKLHTYSDYSYPSGLDEDKTDFYGWFSDKRFKKEFDAILDRLPDFNKLDRCFIHSDMGPHNSLRTVNGDIVLIDLDDAGIGSRYLDLGWPFIMQFVKYNRTTRQMRYRMDLAEAFLSGYYEGNKITRSEYDLLWQGAIFMHISYMQDYGPEAVEPLWEILKFGIEQKEELWQLIEANHNAKFGRK